MTSNRASDPKKKQRILYVAATETHLRRFHRDYVEALRQDYEVFTLATGEGVDFPVEIRRRIFSAANLRAILQIRGILKRERFHGVILNTTLAAFLVRAAMVGMRHRPRVLNFVHGYLFHEPTRGKKEKLFLACERAVRRYTDAVAVMNKMDEQLAREHRLCRGEIYVTRGMGYRFPAELPACDPVLRGQVADENALLLTFVGLLGGDKNQSLLIKAVHALRREGIPAHLMLLGDGPHRPMLEEEIRSLGLEAAVHLMGNQEPAWPYLAVTDVYVSASKKEGLPFNLMEAMACGLPIVAVESKGQVDLLCAHPECLVPMEDIEALCARVKELYRSGRLGMGSVAYEELPRYSFEAVFEENLNVMKGFMKE